MRNRHAAYNALIVLLIVRVESGAGVVTTEIRTCDAEGVRDGSPGANGRVFEAGVADDVGGGDAGG